MPNSAALLIAFLESCGARDVPHTGRSFLGHLIGTRAVLERWGCGEALLSAGLFHSVYGTEGFSHPLVPLAERAALRARIGSQAERLVYLFCVLGRASVYGELAGEPPYAIARRDAPSRVLLTREDMGDLLTLMWANDLEQAAYRPSRGEKSLAFRRDLAQARDFLTERAYADLAVAFGA
jgi:hypothetical protein